MQKYLVRKTPPPSLGPPQGPGHKTSAGPTGGLFFMSEVPLYCALRSVQCVVRRV